MGPFKSQPNTLNIEKLVVKLADLLHPPKEKDLCISRKANRCQCKAKPECLCIDEDYCHVRGNVDFSWTSNNSVIIGFRLSSGFKLNRKNGWCIYTLDQGDQEHHILDVLRRTDLSDTTNRWASLQFDSEAKKIHLPVMGYSMGKDRLELTIRYMDWI